MAKRVADKYLTDQNWDQEEKDGEDEGPGTFRKADEEVLKTRVIRKAKRRNLGQTSGTSAFSGFSGLQSFGSSSASGATFGGFNLHGNGTSSSQAKGFSLLQSTSTVIPQLNPTPTLMQQPKTEPKAAPPITKSSDEEETSQTSREYNRQLSALNKSVSVWIKDHVEKNPLCDLTPIFLDYKKYLSEIDEKYGHSDNDASRSSSQTSDSQEVVSPKSSQSSSQPSQESSASEKPKFSLIGFGPKTDATPKDSNQMQDNTPSEPPPVSKPLFTGFQTPSAPTTSPFKGFNTGPSKGFSGFSFSSSMVGTGNNANTQQNDSQKNADEEEYVPPKPDSNTVVEEDAFFTIRCKLYYKKEDSFADRGVGQLYLKPSGVKTQILIRADTAISQILLNILLSPAIPVKRQGKNNLLIMCIPNPPINEKEKDKVTPLLIRVKTAEDADNLLEIIEQKKKEASEAES